MYKSGAWLAYCDVCRWQYFNFELRKRWDGQMVCHKDFEYDHPQKYIKVSSDPKPVPWIRPEPADIFIESPYVCTILTRSARADVGTADCMQADLNPALE